jgi:hypothetical protein
MEMGILEEAIENKTANTGLEYSNKESEDCHLSLHAPMTAVVQSILHLKRSAVQEAWLMQDLRAHLFSVSRLFNKTKKEMAVCFYCLTTGALLACSHHQECDNKTAVPHQSGAFIFQNLLRFKNSKNFLNIH